MGPDTAVVALNGRSTLSALSLSLGSLSLTRAENKLQYNSSRIIAEKIKLLLPSYLAHVAENDEQKTFHINA